MPNAMQYQPKVMNPGNTGFAGSMGAVSAAGKALAAQLNAATPVATQIKSGLSMVGTTAKKLGGGILRTLGPLGLMDGALNMSGKAFQQLAQKVPA